ncbi:MAG: hypothetical protein AABX66_03590 [Nanoarchaeota archaeon]
MIKGYNKYEKLAETLEGFYTVETLCDRLKISRNRTIYIIHRLRKIGAVKTNYGANKKRLYYVTIRNKQGGTSYTDVINSASPTASYKMMEPPEPHYIYGRTPSYEESLVYAIKQKTVRYTIVSLALFRKISDWNLLYTLAKKGNIVREVVALYEVARKIVRKIKRMPKRFLHLAHKDIDGFKYIAEGISSDDFKDIEKKWKVYIPLNRADLEEYQR